MSAVNRVGTKSESVAVRHLWRAGAIAAVAASIANLVVYFLAPRLFNFSLEIPLMGPGSEIQPLPFFMVIFATIAATIGATILLAALNRFTARPVTIFRVIAVVLLVLSFGAPFSLPVPLNVQLTLLSMHIITAAVILYVLTVQAREK